MDQDWPAQAIELYDESIAAGERYLRATTWKAALDHFTKAELALVWVQDSDGDGEEEKEDEDGETAAAMQQDRNAAQSWVKAASARTMTQTLSILRRSSGGEASQ